MKRRTQVQRVTEFFLNAPIDEARQALDIARTIVENRAPAAPARRRSVTKPINAEPPVAQAAVA